MLNITNLLRDALETEAARLRARLSHLAIALTMVIAAGLIALVGLVFMSIGAYESLARLMPEWQAGGLIAAAGLVLAAVLLLLSRRRVRCAVSRKTPSPEPVTDELRQASERGLRAGEALTRGGMSTVDMALAAFIAGLVVSRSRRPGPRKREGTSDPRP